MKFNPKSPQEIEAEKELLAEGPADFEVMKALDKVSKAGNPMMELTIKVWDCDGKQGTVFDYLVSNVHWKMLQFFTAIGKPSLYFDGDVDAQSLVGFGGKATLALQKAQSSSYKDKIIISEYIAPDSTSREPGEDDDLADIPL